MTTLAAAQQALNELRASNAYKATKRDNPNPDSYAATHIGKVEAYLVGLVGELTPAPPPPTTGIPKFGISTGSIALQWDNATLAFAVARMQELAQGKPFAVRYDASGYNASVFRVTEEVLGAGLTPYLVLYGTTGPRTADSLGQQLASRYRGHGLLFTGPNEPDLHGWGADQLADFQKAIYPSVKAGDPNALCGFGALWKSGPGPQAYIKSLIARARGYADFVSFHGYDPPDQHASWDVWDFWFPGGYYQETCKGLLDAAGWDLPIVSDECGVRAADANQAAKVVNLIDQAKKGRVAGAYIFSLLPDNAAGWQIIEADHTLRPAFQAFKAAVA